MFIGVTEGSAAPVFSLRQELQLEAGRNEASCTLATLPVPGGTDYLWIAVTSPTGDDLTPWHPVARFNVIGPDERSENSGRWIHEKILKEESRVCTHPPPTAGKSSTTATFFPAFAPCNAAF